MSLWNDFSNPVFDGVGLAGFKSRANAFLLESFGKKKASALSFLSPTVLSFSCFHGLVVWDWGLWTDRVFSLPNQKNIYGAALVLIAIMYGSMQGIIAVASLLATMHNPGNAMDPQ